MSVSIHPGLGYGALNLAGRGSIGRVCFLGRIPGYGNLLLRAGSNRSRAMSTLHASMLLVYAGCSQAQSSALAAVWFDSVATDLAAPALCA